MGRFHKTAHTRKLLHLDRKYCVIIHHANGNLSYTPGQHSLKEAVVSLAKVRRTMFITGWDRKNDPNFGDQWDYISYDIADAWVCGTTNCPHHHMFGGLSCMEKINQTRKVTIGKCHYVKCAVEFEISRARKAYCSAKCRKASQNLAYYHEERQSFNRDCKSCEKPFTTSRFDVVCCSAFCRREFRKRTWREESSVIEDAIKEVMVSLFESNGHKPVKATSILNVVSLSHGVSRINSYLVQGHNKGKWQRTKPRFYVPIINGEINV